MTATDIRPTRSGSRGPRGHGLRMAFLCWAELLATQSLFVMAPALLPVYGDGVAAISAVSGLAVGAIMLLLAFAVRRFMTIRFAMWLYLPMAAGYLLLSLLPPLRIALGVLIVIGFSAVQVAFVRAEAPRRARDEKERGFILTTVSSWLVVLQACGGPAVLAAALFLSPAWALRLVALVLLLAFVIGIRFAPKSSRPVRVTTTQRAAPARLGWAAAYNFFTLGQVGCWLMPMTTMLAARGHGEPWSLAAVTSATAAVGAVLLFSRRHLALVPPRVRMRWAAFSGLVSTGAMVAALTTASQALLVTVTAGLLLSQTAVTAGEGAVGDAGAAPGRSWSGAEQLVLNASSAFGFSTVGWVAMHSLVEGWSIAGMPAIVVVLGVSAGMSLVLTRWEPAAQIIPARIA